MEKKKRFKIDDVVEFCKKNNLDSLLKYDGSASPSDIAFKASKQTLEKHADMVTYAGKLCLAPMVRAGELPTRLLALRHGADLVWSPEIIDKKLVQCRRVENDQLQTVDFVAPCNNSKEFKEQVVFRVFPKEEKGKLIFQMGTSNPGLAVEAALKVINDVSGIDVNAGCPKHFSIHSGMGAALLQTPELLCNILTELVQKVGQPHEKPISVKIRVLDDEPATLTLVEKLVKTGISNLTVHCRTTPMRNRESPIRDYLPSIFEICSKNNVSLVMNGGMKNKKEFLSIRKELGLSDSIGGMFAEAAEANPTVFKDEPLQWFEVTKSYLDIARNFDHPYSNVKYMMTRIIPGKEKLHKVFSQTKSMQEIDHIISNWVDPEVGKCELHSIQKYMGELRAQEKLAKQEAGKRKQREQQQKDKLANTNKRKQQQQQQQQENAGADNSPEAKKLKV